MVVYSEREVVCIDYYFDSIMEKVTVESVIVWMVLAGLSGLLTYILFKRGKINATTAIIIPILVFYFSFVLTITVLERTPMKSARYELELFWSYRHAFAGSKALLWENFWNVVLFVPAGAFISILLKKRVWLAGVFGFFISSLVELTQLVTHRGLFEFDDIFHNTLGTFVGVALFLVVKKLTDTGKKQDSGEEAGR